MSVSEYLCCELAASAPVSSPSLVCREPLVAITCPAASAAVVGLSPFQCFTCPTAAVRHVPGDWMGPHPRTWRALLKPTWPLATVFLRCDTCLDGFNVTYMLCPDCWAAGKQRLHRENKHHFSPCCAATALDSDQSLTALRATKRFRPLEPSLPADSPSPALSSSPLACAELTPDEFESVSYCDAFDVLISWKSCQAFSEWRRLLGKQGQFSLGHYCELLMACFERLLRACQQQQPAAANGHDGGQFLRFASFSSTGAPMSLAQNNSHPSWMNAQADTFDCSTGLFAPRDSRDLLAAHGGFLLCPARHRKGEAAVETRDVVMSEYYTVSVLTEAAAQERCLVQRWGEALWSLQPPYGPLFHLPTFSELAAFVHGHMRHGSFDLPELLWQAQALHLDDVCRLLERMVLAAMRCDSALRFLSPVMTGSSSTASQLDAGQSSGPLVGAASPGVNEQQLPPVDSSARDVSGDELQQLQRRLFTLSNTECLDWLSLLDKKVRLEDLSSRSCWPAWQEQLVEVERGVELVAQLSTQRRMMAAQQSALRSAVRRRGRLRSAARSGQLSEDDRVTMSENHPNGASPTLLVSPAFRQWPCDVRQVVSASFAELVLDPEVDVFLLCYQDTGRVALPVNDCGLFHQLLTHLQAMVRIVAQQRQSQRDRRLRVCVMDCRQEVNELDPSWLPQPCFHYWSGFKEGGLLCYPAQPVSKQLSFSDEGQQLQPAGYDFSWGGRIHTACFQQPDAHYMFRTSELFLRSRPERPVPVFPVWQPCGFCLQPLTDFLRWSHRQRAAAEPFDLQAALLAADSIAQQDETCRELRSALLQYRYWETLGRAAQGVGAEPAEIWSLSYELHQRLPPVVALHEFDAASCRAQFAPFLHFVNSRCLPRLREYWTAATQRSQ